MDERLKKCIICGQFTITEICEKCKKLLCYDPNTLRLAASYLGEYVEIKDNPKILRKAAEYLEKHNEINSS